MRGFFHKKRILSLICTFGLSASLLSGCSSMTQFSSNYQTPAGTCNSYDDVAEAVDLSKEGDDELSIYIWDSDANRATLEAAEYAYQQIDPDFSLKIVDARSWDNVQNRLCRNGSNNDMSGLPELTLMQDNAAEFMIRNYPEIFSDIKGSSVNWEDFPESKSSLTTIGGVHYAYPYDNSTCIAAYRTDILQEAGYSLRDMTGITWDRWIEIGKDVYDKTGEYLIAIDKSGVDLPFIMMQAEGESCFKDGEINITDSEIMNEIMAFFQNAVSNNCIYFTSNWSTYLDETLSGQKICGAIGGSWLVPNIMANEDNSGKWGITTLPTFSGKEGYASTGGSSIFILSSCTGKKKQLALDFLDYTIGGGYGAQVTYERGLRDSGFVASYLPCGDYPPYRVSIDFFNGQKIYLDILDYQKNAFAVENNQYYYILRSNLSNEIILYTVDNVDARPKIENALAVVYHQTEYSISLLNKNL